MSISLCCISGGDPDRLAALLRLCRDVVDEIVVALDDRIDVMQAADAIELADQVVRIPYASPPERAQPWAFSHCSGDWIFKLDDDEVPSAALLDGLRAAANPSVTHVWFPRRWLFGGASTYLDAHPWVPDFQLRLSVNDDRLVRFPGELLHVPVEVAGPAAYSDLPIYHLDALRPQAERAAKADDYERRRPGMRAGGLAFNHALYVPELSDAPLADAPAADRSLVEAVLDCPRGAARATPPDVRRASRAEIDALWPRSELDYAAELTVRGDRLRLESGESAQVDLRLENRGESVFAPPAVQVGSRWDGGPPGAWTPLPAVVRPGETVRMAASVVAPGAPGVHTVALDLVHAGVRWFGVPVELSVEVVRRRRVGILIREATRPGAAALAYDVACAAPALEPVFIGSGGEGYAAVPGPEARIVQGLEPGRRKLRSLVLAARRVRALHDEAADVVPVDALILPALEATTLLERWTDLAAVRLAAATGAPILLPPPPPPRGLLDRLLLRALRHTDGVQVGGADGLAAFLEHVGSPGSRG